MKLMSTTKEGGYRATQNNEIFFPNRIVDLILTVVARCQLTNNVAI